MMGFNHTDIEQYYPTPENLAEKMWLSFEGNHISGNAAILEPSAGTGSLIKNIPRAVNRFRQRRGYAADVCEINPERLELLSKTENITIVGHDFLQFRPAKQYSHIIMNPPFNVGTKHLCHAWDILTNGEIVCLLNAASIKNPSRSDPYFLPDLIRQHGSVEYIESAFQSPDTQRKTPVTVALIHLKKQTAVNHSYLDGLKPDGESVEFTVDSDIQKTHELAIPDNVIENAVRVYEQAKRVLYRKVEATCVLEAEYSKYSNLLGGSLLESKEEKAKRRKRFMEAQHDLENLPVLYNEEVAKLKESAWHYMLTGINFYQQLSQKAQKHFSAEFKKVRRLEFTESNIHGFLAGVALHRTTMNDDMMLEMFDRFVERRPENRAYYRSWKSNAKHRQGAWRIKYTRIILPIRCTCYYTTSLDYEAERELLDIDKSFALLDGKNINEVYGLAKAAKACDLKQSERYDSDYFEWRYYSGAKTIHLYPKRKDLIERLNRTAGRLRQWLPPEEGEAGTDFWRQYAEAETISNKMQMNTKGLCQYRSYGSKDTEYMERVEQAHTEACKKLRIPLIKMLAEAAPAPAKSTANTAALPTLPQPAATASQQLAIL